MRIASNFVCRYDCALTLFLRLPLFFFFNDTATTEIYTLSLHDALPISCGEPRHDLGGQAAISGALRGELVTAQRPRSEEHTSELQSRRDLVCRLLLEKKNKTQTCRNYSEKRPRPE